MKANQYDQVEQKIQEIEAEMKIPDSVLLSNDEITPGVIPMWYADLAVLNIDPPTWIVDTLIPDASITIISAPPAQYKTWLAFDIAIKVASGEPVFEQFQTKKTNVLIIDEESGLARTRHRLEQLGASGDAQIAVSSYHSFKLDEASAKSLIDYCKAQKVGLVIFDSLTRIHGGDENSAKDMSAVMGELKRLAQANIGVFLIHHNRKPGQFGGKGANEMRGSGDILAACDVQISVKRKVDSSIITVFQNKNRDAPNLLPFDLEVHSDGGKLWFEYAGRAQKLPNKNEVADKAIVKLMEDGIPRIQAEIKSALKGVVSSNKVGERLPILASEPGLLAHSKGANGRHIYQLQGKQDDD